MATGPTRRQLLVASGAASVAGAAGYLLWPRPVPPPPVADRQAECLYQSSIPGGLVAPPILTADTIYLVSYHSLGFRYYGTVYALDRTTRRAKWSFDDERGMLPSVSPPLLLDDRLFVGEGMHANFQCRLYCLDATTGRKVWAANADDHIESGAVALAGGRVAFGCGNDGVRAVDRTTGERVWQFAPDIHCDTTPEVAGGRVFVGTGPSRRFKTLGVYALDERTGKLLWRHPTDLPSWGGMAAADGRVFVGLANGRLTVADAKPAGAVLALDAATGHELWRVSTADAVFQRPVVMNGVVYFGARDGQLSAVRTDGTILWQTTAGGAVVGAVAIDGETLYAVTVSGRLSARNIRDGRERWAVYLTSNETEVKVYAPVRIDAGFAYVAAMIPQAELGYPCLFRVPVG